jgi:hypothetical protein
MNAPYETARQLYAKHGGNFGEDFAWLLEHGLVVSTPTTFVMGYFCKSDQPTEPTAREDADCIFIVLHAGIPKDAMHQMVALVQKIAYVRAFRGDNRVRVKDIQKFYQLL